jgi:hypothetical protein
MSGIAQNAGTIFVEVYRNIARNVAGNYLVVSDSQGKTTSKRQHLTGDTIDG